MLTILPLVSKFCYNDRALSTIHFLMHGTMLMNWNLLALVAVTFVGTLVLTPVAGAIANRLNIVDRPGGRHQHARVIPKLGGLSIYISLSVVALLSLGRSTRLLEILGVGFIFLLIGIIDDAFHLTPWTKLFGQLAGAIVLVMCGVTISSFGNPLTTQLYSLGGLAMLVTVLWIVSTVNIVNLTDGIDGLVSGLTIISGIVLAILSFKTGHPNTGKLTLIFVGAVAGFWVYNFYPAKIFLGDSGSMLIGFMLAVLGFQGGAKIATAFLVLGVPILDAGLIVAYRFLSHRPIYQGDRNHLHFRLLDSGMSQIKVCLLLYGVSAILGAIALLVPGKQKMLTLALFAITFVIGWALLWRYEKRLK